MNASPPASMHVGVQILILVLFLGLLIFVARSVKFETKSGEMGFGIIIYTVFVLWVGTLLGPIPAVRSVSGWFSDWFASGAPPAPVTPGNQGQIAIPPTGKAPKNADQVVWKNDVVTFPLPDANDGDTWVLKIYAPSLAKQDKRWHTEGIHVPPDAGNRIQWMLPADTVKVEVQVVSTQTKRPWTDTYEVKKVP